MNRRSLSLAADQKISCAQKWLRSAKWTNKSHRREFT